MKSKTKIPPQSRYRACHLSPEVSVSHDQKLWRGHRLKGTAGDQINAILAAAAYNFKSWINQILASPYFLHLLVWSQQPIVSLLNYQVIKIRNPKMSFKQQLTKLFRSYPLMIF